MNGLHTHAGILGAALAALLFGGLACDDVSSQREDIEDYADNAEDFGADRRAKIADHAETLEEEVAEDRDDIADENAQRLGNVTPTGD